MIMTNICVTKKWLKISREAEHAVCKKVVRQFIIMIEYSWKAFFNHEQVLKDDKNLIN